MAELLVWGMGGHRVALQIPVLVHMWKPLIGVAPCRVSQHLCFIILADCCLALLSAEDMPNIVDIWLLGKHQKQGEEVTMRV